MKILDLDDANTWTGSYSSILDLPELTEVAVSTNADENVLGLFEQLGRAPEYVTDRTASMLRQRCIKTLFKDFTHVIACHGCRVADPADYLTKGLLQSQPEQLVDFLLRCAPEMVDRIHAAARDLGSRYFDWNRGTVCFLFSQQWAMCEKTHYSYGSELIQGIVNRVGPELARKYVATGKPSLIRCRIPVGWIKAHSKSGTTHETYAIEPLRIMIRDKFFSRVPDEGPIWPNGGFRLAKSIPPYLIEDIVDMSEIVQDDKWIQQVVACHR